jgi:hypothetical protein
METRLTDTHCRRRRRPGKLRSGRRRSGRRTTLTMTSLPMRTWLVRATRTVMRTGRTISCKFAEEEEGETITVGNYNTKHFFATPSKPAYFAVLILEYLQDAQLPHDNIRFFPDCAGYVQL